MEHDTPINDPATFFENNPKNSIVINLKQLSVKLNNGHPIVAMDCEWPYQPDKNGERLIHELGLVKIQNGFREELNILIDHPNKRKHTDKLKNGIRMSPDAVATFLPTYLNNTALLGHDLKNDFDKLNEIGCKIKRQYLNTVTVSRHVFHDNSRHRLVDFVRYCGVDKRPAHIAVNDAAMIMDSIVALTRFL